MLNKYLDLAAQEAEYGTSIKDGGPFGAIITDKEGNIISKGHNMVIKTNDPTAHAEITAIRNACNKLQTKDLSDCILYSSCEPCPMCLSAIIWSNIKTVYYGATRYDASKIGFRDNDIYEYLANKNEIIKKEEVLNENCKKVLENYKNEVY